ncbi:MAG TPA: hypothetical protein VFM04_05320 [Candidatus Methylomirabilis sp.]|nr:hypothetical protein [Candidatus Methylomirabilis sp.]
MIIHTERSAYLYACAAGAITWIATAQLGHRREAWDASLYWVAAYPALGLVLAWISFEMPLRPWRWVFTAMFSQAAILFLSDPSGNLLPLGLIMFGLLSLPLMIPATIGARLGRKRTPR